MDRILVVEEDRFFRERYAQLLESHGYGFDCAACGSDALKMLSCHRYGLVIMELAMPDYSGLEFLSIVKGSDPSTDVIIVTGNANLESAIFALKHGARDYLIKPVNSDEFLHSVALCMEQRRILDENEELKSMLHLFQTSQTIAGCLEIERVYHLVLEAIAREIGVCRGFGLFLGRHGLELIESKGISETVAEHFRDIIVPTISKCPAENHVLTRLRFDEPPELRLAETGIEEAYLIFLCSKEVLHGIIVVFNDPATPLPGVAGKKKNILFLQEQSLRAFENASSYSLAKDMLFIDDLSGLFNQRYFEVALDRELKRIERYKSQLAVLFLDVDCFKLVNDTHGHPVGSRILKEMGALLKRSVRDVDVVIRYGGDEFTIILVETSPEAAGIVAERIRSLIASHEFTVDGERRIRLTCSIGYSCCPDDTTSKQDLLRMADDAMYVGKKIGKNCVTRYTGTP
ncbi:diguanylate cyclase [Geobacter sp. SVR]|uniref:GGDEF domain-containing response regulator n=1 Tax=Geobacter sp. SVR TaxID=2495594 RepID=UPI00143EFA3F|nr:diguanylate cyclase [Geobacter sp. SVR]BCS53814.1 diguanylate cyclase response regulator [Geobacter sp. SVR]GCF85677.1 diguanylate cyclase response regulator [Geobacter sp. SVR]